MEEEINKVDTKLSYNHLTRLEREAPQNLRDDSSIVIKEADKGSAVVVWDRDDYLAEAESQLGDGNVYEKLEGTGGQNLIDVVESCLLNIKVRGDIGDKTLDYFLINNPRLGRFYLLPKIHKRLYNVPGRPVISNCGYYTENISAFLDHHLKPLAKTVKSFIKDTNHFLQKLKGLPNLSKHSLLCTIDVVGLYPNIPHDEGLEAIRKRLDQRQDKKISTDSLVELAECVLKNNHFEHNGQFFRQKRGTAIGTKMAPQYAIVFMAELEEKLLGSYELKPEVWWRYIDDIFMIWEHGEENLQKFMKHLNSQHHSIKFTFEYSPTSVNFLDVQVIRVDDKLVTDLFVKPTDTHQYLHASSCHVYHTKKAIPYSQALRLNRICSESSFFDLRCDQLALWLKERGYSDKLIRKEIMRARKPKRDDLLFREQNEKTRGRKLVFNLTYHPAFSRIKDVLKDIHVLLSAPNEEHKKVFSDVPIVGFKRGKSIKDFLVRSKLPVKRETVGQSEACQKARCQICPSICKTKSFESSQTSEKYEIRAHLDCDSVNAIYLVTCKTCHKQYVGSTVKFRNRFNNYKSCFRKCSLGETAPQVSFHSHFLQEDHNGMEDWEFTLIDQSQNEQKLRMREDFWINKLQTFEPQGLNEREVTIEYG